ncbi:MAG: hypothetical protein LIP09_13675 [Bacteroidales bacterium]|nr:hypothetical protein [Bacteroidales bacterium]
MKHKWIIGLVIGLTCGSAFAQTDYEEFIKQNQQEYTSFNETNKKEYDEFRKKINQEYADFLRNPWKQRKADPVIKRPKGDTIPPVIIKKEIEPAPKPVPQPFEEILPTPQPKPQPQPIKPIYEIPDPKPTPEPEPVKPLVATHDFEFYGTKATVRFDRENRISLSSVSELPIADAWVRMSGREYNNLIYDCLQLRRDHKLNDWAYLMMLKAMAESIQGVGTPEATLLMAYVYCQSGYKMRLAYDNGKLLMLYASDHLIYNITYYLIDGSKFYIFGGNRDGLNISNVKFPKEQSLSLIITEVPLLDMAEIKGSPHNSKYITDIHTEITANKNLLAFYDSYPASMYGNDQLTQWAMYANMPMPEHIKDQLYPMIRQAIQGLTQLEAANKILRFVQTGLVYGYDNQIWGYDRAFFPEETLYYPYSDCEDHSIILSRIIRDILGLKCALVLYPGHLATAIEITEGEPTGDYFLVNGRRFFIADGTITGCGAPIGRTMNKMNNNQARLIVL